MRAAIAEMGVFIVYKGVKGTHVSDQSCRGASYTRQGRCFWHCLIAAATAVLVLQAMHAQHVGWHTRTYT